LLYFTAIDSFEKVVSTPDRQKNSQKASEAKKPPSQRSGVLLGENAMPERIY
jgi:hypothetical protein